MQNLTRARVERKLTCMISGKNTKHICKSLLARNKCRNHIAPLSIKYEKVRASVCKIINVKKYVHDRFSNERARDFISQSYNGKNAFDRFSYPKDNTSSKIQVEDN